MRALALLLLVATAAVAAPVPKSIKKKPVASPDGVWHLVEFDSDGKGGSVASMARNWEINGETIACWTDGQPRGGGSKFAVRDPARPNERMWGTNVAVYEVDGDTLRCCYAHDGRKELTECKPQMGVHFYVFQRVK